MPRFFHFFHVSSLIVTSILSSSIMVWDYQAEAMKKFPVPAVPNEDNYTDNNAYQQDFEEYQHQCAVIMARQKKWVMQERADDEQKAEAVRQCEMVEVAATQKCEAAAA